MTRETTTIETVARELAGAFTTDTRNSGEQFTKIRDDAPEWTRADNSEGECLMLRVHRAIDDRLPDDWVYENASRVADRLAEYDNTGDMRDAISEIADGLVDIYNIELARWLASNLNNLALCDEAAEEMGSGNAGGIVGMMQAGQYSAIERIAGALIDAIEQEADGRE